MTRSSILGLAAFLALALAAPAGPARAQAGGGKNPQTEAEALAREAIEKMMNALDLLLQSVPQYEAPVIEDNGDILIRRKHPAPERKPPASDGSKT